MAYHPGSPASSYESEIAKAIVESPDVNSARLQWQAALKEGSAAGRWEDPHLSASIMNPLTFGGPQLTLSQSLLVPAKYEAEIAEASASAEVAGKELEQRLADVRNAAI
ncbi:MAG: TolC family protein, partial [Cyanobacteria bacterium REEB65]|nr:TolC family protein [Cyanobacteria bacterium REEB65]